MTPFALARNDSADSNHDADNRDREHWQSWGTVATRFAACDLASNPAHSYGGGSTGDGEKRDDRHASLIIGALKPTHYPVLDQAEEPRLES